MKSAHAVVISYALKILAAIIAFWVLVPLSASADLEALSDAQLAQIDATGFSAFVIDGNTVRADFNIQAQTYTEIGSLKIGRWDNGSGIGWDQDWTLVQLGYSDADMTLSGLFIEATFDDIDSDQRRLTSVFFGFRQASGDLSAQFNSLSKIGANGDPDEQRALLAGRTTFTFNNSELAFSFQLEGENRGVWVRFGADTTRQTTP